VSVSGHSGVALPVGIPPGGDLGEQLTKLSGFDYDVDWEAAGGGGGGAPATAQYLVAALDGGLVNERLVINTASLLWNFGTPNQARADYVPDYADTLIASQVFGS
jgi:hypothetical protein